MSGKPEMDENHFSGADISCVLHATEDENNVLKSASETFSISKDRFFFKRLEGHWGNPIIYLIALLDSKEAWTTALKIMLSLNPLERNQLKESLHDLVDEKGNMYIRLDKQGMCRGKINLSEFDSVRIKFRPVKTFRKISNVPDYKVILSLDE
jgi:RNA-binding protein